MAQQPPAPPQVNAARPQRKPSEWTARATPTPGVARSTEDPKTPRLSELAQRAARASLVADPTPAGAAGTIDPQWTTPGGGVLTPAPAGAASAPTAADQQKLHDIKKLLEKSATGRDALAYLDAKKIGVDFLTGQGGYWDAPGHRMVIDRTYSTDFSALVMVHEVHHARMSLTAATGDVLAQSRADYVKTMLNEEAVGTVLSIRTKQELIAAGVPIASTFALEPQYTKAYNGAVAALRAATPAVSADALGAAGGAAGLQRVIQGFTSGAVPTSTTGEPYPQFYGGAWDAAHPPKGK